MEDEPQEPTNEESEDAPEFDPEEIENDPAHNPDDEGLKGLKGG
jgi:hypothetical protein